MDAKRQSGRDAAVEDSPVSPRWGVTCRAAFALGMAIALALAAPARAFDVPYHQDITKEALARIRVTIAGHEYGFTEKAVLEICKYNIATDDCFPTRAALFHPEWHFTNEAFAASSAGLIQAKNQALAKLQGYPVPLASLARQEIGRATHTVQDFYSHSNWVELGGGGLFYEKLGMEVLPNPPAYLRPCPVRRDTINDDGLRFLTSAYFVAACGCGGVDPGKCYHGNYGSLLCAGACDSDGTNGINKDTSDRVDFGPAYASAVAATEDYIYQIIKPLQEMHDERALAALLGVVGVGFAIDVSNSMVEMLPGAKRTAVSLAANPALQDAGMANVFVLAAFDGSRVFSTVTDSPDEFSASVASLATLDGTESCPENMYGGLLAAISNLPPDSELYLFTDAPAVDAKLRPRVASAARAKHIRITSFSENNCSGAVAARDSRNIGSREGFSSSSKSANSSALSIPPDVSAITADTGGIVFGLSHSPTADYSPLILPGALGRSQVVLSRILPAPVARNGHAMTYDSMRGAVTLFGGLTAAGYSGETWECSGTSWTSRPSAGPSARYLHAMAYDKARGVSVLFGGYSSAGRNGETWEWNGASWTLRATAGPSARNNHAMAYDRVRGVTVLFGGYSSTGRNGDTWEWNGASWNLRATTGPSARHSHAMVYDSARNVTVLFGGSTGSGDSGETWEWNGASWTLRSSTGPSSRNSHAMAYDTARGVTVLFGGYAGTNSIGETWEWNGIAWTEGETAEPSARYSHSMTYDATHGVTALFGGYTASDNDGTSWEWSGTAWTLATRKLEIPIDTTSSMQVRISSGIATLFDPGMSLVTGATPGVNVQTFGESTVYTIASPIAGSWSLKCNDNTSTEVTVDSDIALADASFVSDNSAAPEGVHGGYAPIADLPLAGETQILKATLLGALANAQFSLFDEYGAPIGPVSLARNYPRAVTDDYFGVVMPPAQPFRLVATGMSASGRAFRREFGTLFRSVPFRVVAPPEQPAPAMDGGQGLYTFTIENRGPTRTLNLAAVGVLGTAITATPASVTVPANGNQLVVVSDPTTCDNFLQGAAGEVRLFASDVSDSNLSNSAAVEVEVSPSGLGCLRNLSFGRGVLFGGFSSAGSDSETWELNGNSWTLRATTGPSPRYDHAMAYDTARGVMVLFGGHTSEGFNGETWELNGTSWAQRATTGPPARNLHAMAYDSARRVTVLFGGNTSGGRSGETWEWNGTSWTQRATTGPSTRNSHAMAYDAARGVTVLFGGNTSATSYDSETWEWNGALWTRRATTGPSGRYGHAMVYDSTRGVTVLFGGLAAGGWNGETWEWNGTLWTRRGTTGPWVRYQHAMAYDPARGITELFGGYNPATGYNGETWEWDGALWTQVATGWRPAARVGSAMAYDSVCRVAAGAIRLGGVRIGNTVDLDENSGLANLTLEDATGAVTVFGSNTMIQGILDMAGGNNLLSGISGTAITFNGLRELVDVTSVTPANASVPVHVISVQPADFADHSATAEGLESHVVVLDNYTFGQSGAFMVGNYLNGGVTLRVSTAALADALNAQFGAIPTGVPLKITGVFSQYDTAPPFDGGYQLLATNIKIPCPADINGDGLVEDADFSIFVVAYDILDCADPSMPAGCPADLNGDGLVDDSDFSIFVVAYDALVCP